MWAGQGEVLEPSKLAAQPWLRTNSQGLVSGPRVLIITLDPHPSSGLQDSSPGIP